MTPDKTPQVKNAPRTAWPFVPGACSDGGSRPWLPSWTSGSKLLRQMDVDVDVDVSLACSGPNPTSSHPP